MSFNLKLKNENSVRSRNVLMCIISAIFINIVLLMLITTYASKELFYDEPWYLSSVSLWQQHGLSSDFLRSLPGPAGPLYPLVHAVLAPLTGMTTPGVRFVNVGMLIATLFVLRAILRIEKSAHPTASALSFTAAPMIWVVTGIALTEMAATFFSVLSVCFLWYAFRVKSTGQSLGLSALGGLCLGIAILGRQPLLVLLAVLPVFVLYNQRTTLRVSLFVASALIMPLTVFTIWGGLVPPLTSYVGSGVAPMHGLLSLTYAGVVMLIWSPSWFRMNYWIAIAIVAGTTLGNVFIGMGEHAALRSLAVRFISPDTMPLYGRIVWGALVSVGILFLFAQLRHTWANRANVSFVFLSAVVLLLLLSSVKITHLFSSRYVVAALPFLLLLAEPFTVTSGTKAVRTLFGGLIGALALYGYYQT